METKTYISTNGQELQSDDVNNIASVAALADDNVFQELFKLGAFTSSARKAIIPSSVNADFVATGGANAKLRIQAFRAFVGPRTSETVDVMKSVRDIRSAYKVGAYDAGNPTPNGSFFSPAFSAGSGGGLYRWDLLYATITPDVDASPVTRYVKDPLDGSVSALPCVASQNTLVTLAIQAGTGSTTVPALPARPADGGGSYNISICYVRIDPTFDGATGIIDNHDIMMVAPIAALNSTTGAVSLGITPGNNTLTTAQVNAWGIARASKPTHFLPSDMVGGFSKIIVIKDYTAATHSHANGAVIDGSIDWRNRIIHYEVQAVNGTGAGGAVNFPWAVGSSGPASFLPTGINSADNTPTGWYRWSGFGQTFVNDDVGTETSGGRWVFRRKDTETGALAVGKKVGLYVGNSGVLQYYATTGDNDVAMIIKLDASAQMSSV